MLALIGKAHGKQTRAYIPVKAAGKLFGYNQQYLRRLLRQEKLRGIKIARLTIQEPFQYILSIGPSSKIVIHFAPYLAGLEALKRAHGFDERIIADSYLTVIRFYIRFIQNSTGA